MLYIKGEGMYTLRLILETEKFFLYFKLWDLSPQSKITRIYHDE